MDIVQVHINEVINLTVPHVGEQIFGGLETDDLIHCLKVSNIWRDLAEKTLLSKWTGKLLEACRKGKIEVIDILLDNLEETDELKAKDGVGKTAFHLACFFGHGIVVKSLLDHPSSQNMDINAQDKYGETGFIYACENGHKEVVKLLLDHPNCKNLDVNHKDKSKYTAYNWALEKRHTEIIQLLEEYSESRGIDLSSDIVWQTALCGGLL